MQRKGKQNKRGRGHGEKESRTRDDKKTWRDEMQETEAKNKNKGREATRLNI